MLPFKRILCPTDFSEPACTAIKAAAEMAKSFSAELILIHVVGPIPALDTPAGVTGFDVSAYQRELTESAESSLQMRIETHVPEAIDADEATKQTLTVSEVTSMRPYYGTDSLSIQVPVLILIGDDDLLGCSEAFDCRDHDMVEAHEQTFFSPEACIETNVIERTGHNINLHLNAPESYAIIHNWMKRRIGISQSNAPSAPCEP